MSGIYDGAVRINTLLNTDNFLDGIKHMHKGVGKLENSIGNLKCSVGELIKSLGAGLSIAGIVMMGKEAIELASDIQEVQNVVDTAFGSMSYKMEKFPPVRLQYG